MDTQIDIQGTPKLGLVCITISDEVRFRTVTRKRLLQFEPSEQKRMLRDLYADNLARLGKAIEFCSSQSIKLYRLTSALFPFADDPAGTDVLDEFSEGLQQAGERAIALGLRLVLHPDQFVVLSSDSPHVIENSIKILETHARILDLLAQPRSSWTVMNIHGGKSDRAERLVSTIQNLPEPIRSRLALENDEHCYGASEILDVCRAAGVPMVFDAHHHVCRERLTSYNDPSIVEMAVAARSTWPIPEWQLTHISNGREFFNDPRHSDLITEMPDSFRDVPWIEVEAKHKEVAIQKLHAEWLINGHKSAPAGALQSGKAAGEG
ncbi:MAG: UV DNA damage repair endonuclease UvsE [Pyrinomonadaceae bacterium]|nr:UV DNA damage repair endonuclease UvsE [Pyrinomonadaceae bacterium]